MLHPDLQMIGLSGAELANWWRLSVPPRVFTGSWAVVVRGQAGDSFAVCKDRGRVELGAEAIAVDEPGLERLRERLGVDLVAVCDPDALARLQAAAENRAVAEPDFLGQWLSFYDAVRQLRGKGLWTAPTVLDILPPLRRDALARAFDLLIPNRTSVVAYVFDAGAVHASVVATKIGGVIDTVAGHAALAERIPHTAIRSWSSQYRLINDAVAEVLAPPSVSVFAERAAIVRVQRGPGEQLSRELAQRTIIIDPMPAWLAGLVGGAAAAALAGKSAQALSRFLPRSARRAAEAVVETAKDRLRDSPANPLAVLGFDPLLLWESAQRWYR